MSVLTARPAVEALEARAVDAEPCLRAAGLSRAALASIENRLPFAAVKKLWEAAAVAAHDRSLGVHAAETLPSGAYDLFDYLMSAAQTVEAGILRWTRYVRLIYDRSNLELIVEPASARVVRRVPETAPQYDEFALTLLLVRSRQASARDWRPEHMRFQHERPADDGELSRVFGCPVVFGAPEAEMRIAPSVLQLPHVHADSRLLAVLSRYADSLLAALPARGPLLCRVSSTIAQQMARELPTLASTAAAVHMPQRTLQRRLAADGASHSSMLDDVRRGLALKYIADAAISIGEIAYLLHFNDSTAFYRAFRRWTGESPLKYRQRLFKGGRR